ncbi:MAG: FadR family transcriptional regulator [Frankia sp.]|nr:FadR family transcriptional regulator [Frankia sp.]
MALLHPTEIDKRRTPHALRVARVGGAVGTAAARPRAAKAGALLDDGRVGRHVRVPKTAELVAAPLRRQIVRGELVEGDALPPEAVLMEQFGVSRPTLREAFRVLESEALISVRRGAHGGARVHTPNGQVAARYAGLVLEHRGTTIADVEAARASLETLAVRMLATAPEPAALARLRAAVADTEPRAGWADEARGEARPGGGDAGGADGPPADPRAAADGFHRLLIELAGNQTLSVLDAMLRHILGAAASVQLPPPVAAGGQHNGRADAGLADGRRGGQADGALSAHHEAHRRLVELVERRDPDGAEALWRDHLAAEPARPDSAAVLDLLGE